MIKVGVTGRRDLSGFNMTELINKVRMELENLKRSHSRFIMLNSIAVGADQLCAQIGLELGYELICPLPFTEYRGDFSGKELELYNSLIGKANDYFIVSNSSNRDAAYLAAGKYIAENCDVLLVVWDGKAQKDTCGTDAVIAYAKSLERDIHIILGM